MGHQAYLKVIQTFIKKKHLKKKQPWDNFLIFLETMQLSCGHHCMIKLIKITTKYIK